MKECLTCGTMNEDKVQECIKCTGIQFPVDLPEPKPDKSAPKGKKP